VQRPRTAAGHHHEVTRVVPAPDAHLLEGVGHVRVHDLEDAVGSLADARAELVGQRFERAAGRLGVEGHLAAEEVVGVEAARE